MWTACTVLEDLNHENSKPYNIYQIQKFPKLSELALSQISMAFQMTNDNDKEKDSYHVRLPNAGSSIYSEKTQKEISIDILQNASSLSENKSPETIIHTNIVSEERLDVTHKDGIDQYIPGKYNISGKFFCIM